MPAQNKNGKSYPLGTSVQQVRTFAFLVQRASGPILVVMSNGARVCIIMPVYNEAAHLPFVLRSLEMQSFDRGRLRVIAVDGGSIDGSAEMIDAWMKNNRLQGCVLCNPLRKIPISLNLALAHANEDEIIIRADAHTIYGETYVEDVVEALCRSDAEVACVGGAQLPVTGITFEQHVIEALYTNPMGLGGAGFRRGEDVREVDSVYLGAWRPGVLQKAGGFNESMDANEDGELAARLRERGFRIVRTPLPCRFIINRSLWQTIRQWNRYGYWRAKMLRRHPRFVRLRHIVTPAAALACVALVFTPLRALLALAFVVYGGAVFLGRGKREPLGVTAATVLFFPVLQFAFAAGMFSGLLSAAAVPWPAVSSRAASSVIES